MRGRIVFAFLFALTLWACTHLLGQTQARRAALPPMERVSAQVALAPAQQAFAATRPAAQAPRKAAALPQPISASCRPAPVPRLTLPYYRAAWHAFRLEGSAG